MSSIQEAAGQLIEAATGDTGGETTGDTGGETTGDTGGETTGDTGGETTGDTGGRPPEIQVERPPGIQVERPPEIQVERPPESRRFHDGRIDNVVTPVTGIRSCSLDGTSVGHQSSITAYLTASVPFGGTCQTETRSCIDGSLSGSYAFVVVLRSQHQAQHQLSVAVSRLLVVEPLRERGRSAAATASSSISVNQPVKSLVSVSVG